MTQEKKTGMRFFGIDRILPYLKHVRKLILVMVIFGLLGSLVDIILPLFQRYALDHFVGKGVFDTIVPFVIGYLLTIIL